MFFSERQQASARLAEQTQRIRRQDPEVHQTDSRKALAYHLATTTLTLTLTVVIVTEASSYCCYSPSCYLLANLQHCYAFIRQTWLIVIPVGVAAVGVACCGGTASGQASGCKGCCLSGCLSGNAVVEGILFHVVGPGGRRHAAVRVQKDPEAADDQEAQEDEEDEEEDKGRPLLQGEKGGTC